MADHTHVTSFNPNPIQRQFIESRAKADLYSSRMGEGKSTALAWSAFYHTRHNPGANWVLIRDTWENISKTTMKTFFDWFPPGIYGTWVSSRKEFTWAEGVAKGTVEFMGMDAPEDAAKLMSREIAGFGMDEPAPAMGSVGIDEMIFDLALTRLRQPGMNWYAAKLAENNPDEGHWTYRRFEEDDREQTGFRLWQPNNPENIKNLPANYYENMRRTLSHRPDLVRRFVDGEFGFQQVGKSVTPQWNDRMHLTLGLYPLRGIPVYCLWDFGHNQVCILTQRTPMGHWNILDCIVGEDMGTEEIIVNAVAPLVKERYPKLELKHIGDPAGLQREQASTKRSAVRVIKQVLGGTWQSGPVRTPERIEPLRAVLTRTTGGRAVVQVDKMRAAPVWHALRGGWHFHVARTGTISGEPLKNHPHSDVGDAMGYGAAVLFPMGRAFNKGAIQSPQAASYFETPMADRALGLFKGGSGAILVPDHGSRLLPK